MLALVVACDEASPTGPTAVASTDALIAALRARGATVSLGEVLRNLQIRFSQRMRSCSR